MRCQTAHLIACIHSFSVLSTVNIRGAFKLNWSKLDFTLLLVICIPIKLIHRLWVRCDSHASLPNWIFEWIPMTKILFRNHWWCAFIAYLNFRWIFFFVSKVRAHFDVINFNCSHNFISPFNLHIQIYEVLSCYVHISYSFQLNSLNDLSSLTIITTLINATR